MRFESARCLVFGSHSSEISAEVSPQDAIHDKKVHLQQKACICAVVGPSGSGKKTIVKALAYELGRSIKLVCSSKDVVRCA